MLFIICVQEFKEPEAEVKLRLIIGSLTRSSAVAKRPRDAPCRWKYYCHSKSLKVTRI